MWLLGLTTLVSAGLLPFVWRGHRSLEGWRRVPALSPPLADQAPRVVVLVPARNEERSIERCVRSLLRQTYPADRYRVVVMDDRSEDATPRILAAIQREDRRLTVLQGSPLPTGWQGKCWALHQAVRQAAGDDAEYLVFVDADTVHEPHMLASTIGFAASEALDLLSVVPGQELGTPAERLLLPSLWALTLSANGTLDEVNDPTRTDIAKAIGHFILFRAASYRAMGGHEAVRSEIVEDFALARLAKGSGYRVMLADGRGLLRTRMYRSAREIWNGYSKNAYDEAQKAPGGAAAVLVALATLGLWPWLALVLGWRHYQRHGRRRDWLTLVQGAAQAAASVLLGATAARVLGLPARYGLAEPASALFLAGILLNSTWRTVSGRGVTWKGRTY